MKILSHVLRKIVLCHIFFFAPFVSASADNAPLPANGIEGFYQRLLTIPETMIFDQPNGTPISTPPIFSIYYVYENIDLDDGIWQAVGKRSDGTIDGYVEKRKTQPWHHMLVMRFAPRGVRSRVPFFKDRHTLADLVQGHDSRSYIDDLYAGIEDGRPDKDILIAVEPATMVSTTEQPYLLPILDWRDVRVQGVDYATMLEVASVSGAKTNGPGNNFDDRGQGKIQSKLKDFKYGVVFVVDTTQSMGPYIERTYDVIASVYEAFDRAGKIDSVSFGLIGYRDNTSYDPGVEYVTKVFQELDPGAEPDQVLANLRLVKAADSSTPGWDEDAYAGLLTALESSPWDQFDARFVVLITDAGARSGDDPLAKYAGINELTLIDAAKRNSVALFPIHLLTEEATSAGNVPTAEQQYKQLALTGDSATSKYLSIPAEPPSQFKAVVADIADGIVDAAVSMAGGKAIDPVEIMASSTGAPSARDLVINEIFRAQLEFLGRDQGTMAPDFYRAWSLDKDLRAPKRDALEVGVFLTRNQLNALAQQVDLILEAAKTGKSSSEDFFNQLQILSARTSHDANLSFDDETSTIGESNLMPDYLESLPYHSDILQLSKSYWQQLGRSGQQEFIEDLEFKKVAYQRINDDDKHWVDVGAGSAALEVYALPLIFLP